MLAEALVADVAVMVVLVLGAMGCCAVVAEGCVVSVACVSMG
jgi:hypothetical protein